MSTIWKRIIGLCVGFAYGVGLGLFCLLMTGGGHGNVPWIVFFIVACFGGFFYPVMGFIVADLDSIISKTMFITLFVVHLLLIGVYFFEGLGTSNASPRDFSWEDTPMRMSMMITLFVVPQMSALGLFVKSVLRNRDSKLV